MIITQIHVALFKLPLQVDLIVKMLQIHFGALVFGEFYLVFVESNVFEILHHVGIEETVQEVLHRVQVLHGTLQKTLVVFVFQLLLLFAFVVQLPELFHLEFETEVNGEDVGERDIVLFVQNEEGLVNALFGGFEVFQVALDSSQFAVYLANGADL